MKIAILPGDGIGVDVTAQAVKVLRAALGSTPCMLSHGLIGGAAFDATGNYLPPDLNSHIPKTWLFWHRWEAGGRDPRTRTPLARAEIGGRTTCWSPARQKL